jgi:carbon monoxide dehydrogenase subunit G
MDLTHRFSVPAQMDEAWNAFNDLEGLAPCFPGATITSVEGDEFSGSVKIKLGPIALVYNGSGRYVERNDAERRVVIEARGKDKRGNGTATATVTAKFAGNGDQTQIEVFTDLAITGKPAQFGRGVISDVSDKLLNQFVSCVSDRFAQSGLGAAQASSANEAAAATSTALQGDESDTEQTIELEAVPADEEVAAVTASADGRAPAPSATPPTAPPTTAPPTMAPPTMSPPGLGQPQAATRESTLDVLGTVGPVLLRRYGPALAVVALLVFVVIKIARRKS